MTMQERERLIAAGWPVQIVSGEGEYGTPEQYHGNGAISSIRARLTRERCNGDRWARAVMYSHRGDDGNPIGVNLETGEYCTWMYDD